MRKVALEIVQLGRDVPEEEWFEDAEHFAVSLIRRLVEEAYDVGRQGDLSSLGAAEVTPGADSTPADRHRRKRSRWSPTSTLSGT